MSIKPKTAHHFGLFILLFICTFKAFAFENLVYTWRGFPNHLRQGKIAIADFKKHSTQIDILSSQAYHISETGLVYGAINTQMSALAHHAAVKEMPLVGNNNFDRKLTHIFLSDEEAQKKAIHSILELCQKNHFLGVQVDFEGMSYQDRSAFTSFYQNLAKTLHQAGFQISITIVPMVTEKVPTTDYLIGKFKGWAGVYDYKVLGECSDFVTLMAYDQHGGITTPGPMAGLSWDEAIIRYALKYIPSEKLSLGLPWHSGYWHTGKTEGSSLHALSLELSYPEMEKLIKENKISLKWDPIDKIHYARYRKDFLDEYIFLEDAKSFKAKLALVKKYKLRGVSNWCLGEEDPKIWNLLPNHRAG